jgi:hypothetical protein
MKLLLTRPASDSDRVRSGIEFRGFKPHSYRQERT